MSAGRAARALERQLDYQRRKAQGVPGNEDDFISSMRQHSQRIRERLSLIHPITPEARVLEVGSGAHGLIFFFGLPNVLGVDPLAEPYAELFPWQGRVPTIAAAGEALPFADARFDVVLCDNVVDHAESPARIIGELARVLVPGGLLYFTVNIHHPLYHRAATVHAAWRALGIPFEVTPFADHTVHLTREAAVELFDRMPLRLLSVIDDIDATRRRARTTPPRHPADRLKRRYFKNAQLEVVATRVGEQR